MFINLAELLGSMKSVDRSRNESIEDWIDRMELKQEKECIKTKKIALAKVAKAKKYMVNGENKENIIKIEKWVNKHGFITRSQNRIMNKVEVTDGDLFWEGLE